MKLNGKSLIVFGDSIINGSGNNNFGVGEYLNKKTGVALKKYCVGGARVGYQEGKDWVVEQIKRAVANGATADIVVFNGFTNDCNMTDGKTCDVPLGEIEEDKDYDLYNIPQDKKSNFTYCFQCVLTALKKYFGNALIVFVRPHKMGRRDLNAQQVYGRRAAELCKTYGFAVADVYEDTKLDTFNPVHRDKYTADTYGWGKGDCTHPNAKGYEKFYIPLIIKVIKKHLKDKNL